MMKTAGPDKIVVAGDWHSNSGWACSVVRQAGVLLDGEPEKIILQVGDFGVWYGVHGDAYLNDLAAACAEVGVIIWFLDGNHEAFPRLYSQFRGQVPRYHDLIWLERGSRWRWHGRKWLALGGATSLDRPNRTEGESWFPEEEITDEDVHNATSMGRADVMVTHDCPSSVVHAFPDFGFSPAEQSRAEGHSKKLQRVVDKVQPSYLIHGHLHICYQRETFQGYGECQVTGLGRDGDETNWFVLDVKNMEFLEREG